MATLDYGDEEVNESRQVSPPYRPPSPKPIPREPIQVHMNKLQLTTSESLSPSSLPPPTSNLPPKPNPAVSERDAVFQFQGSNSAATSDHPSHDFSFIQAPPAPLPNIDSYRPPPRESARDRDRNRPGNRDNGRGRWSRDKNRDRQDRKPFQPRPALAAHDRPILKLLGREKTPEQYPAMVQTEQAQSVADDGDAAMDLDSADEDKKSEDDVVEHAAKRVRTDGKDEHKPDDPAAPEKKVDFINMIRSIKEAAHLSKRNAVSNNDDFISLAVSDPEESSGEETTPYNHEQERSRLSAMLGKPVPAGPAFSHREFHHSSLPQSEPNRTSPVEPKERKATGKRNHDDFEASSGDPGVIQYEMRGNGTNDDTPWLKSIDTETHEKSLYPSVWLHKEILDFHDFIKPQPYEHLVRHDLVHRIRTVVKNQFPDADIRAFGSFAAKLYLPTSDMDLVLVSGSFIERGIPSFNTNSSLSKVASLMTANKICAPGTMQIIRGARVPIIKFVDQLTGLHVDISFENLSGLVAIDTFKQWKEVYPDMPKIAMVIKQFLSFRTMNEPFNGGLGSFSVICLVVSLLQMMPEASSGNWDQGGNVALGRLLMEFFNLYGKKFNTTMVGIKVAEPGYFQKANNPLFFNAKKSHHLSIMDPNNPENDISKATFRILDVFRAFSQAYDTLEKRMAKMHWSSFDERQNQSLLGCVLGGNYEYIYKQRTKMRNAYLYRNLGSPNDLAKLGTTAYSDLDEIVVAAKPVGELITLVPQSKNEKNEKNEKKEKKEKREKKEKKAKNRANKIPGLDTAPSKPPIKTRRMKKKEEKAARKALREAQGIPHPKKIRSKRKKAAAAAAAASA